MSRIYTDEEREWLCASIPGRRFAETARLFAERFGKPMTAARVKSFANNNGVRSGMPRGHGAGLPSKEFPQSVRDYIMEHKDGKPLAALAAELSDVFGRPYTYAQVKSFFGNHRLTNGLNGRFCKGHVPANKGRKGWCAHGCEKGWFVRGRTPHNHLPVGAEVTDSAGYRKVKVAEPNRWQFLHRLVWEKERGKIPAGMLVEFRDGDRRNCDIGNLVLVSREEHAVMNRLLLRSTCEAFDTAVLTARLRMRLREIALGRKKDTDIIPASQG